MPEFRLEQVVKAFGAYRAADAVSFTIPEGSIFGMLGPNGAGKTTLIRMMTQILIPDSGILLFDNKPLVPAHMEVMGYMPEERGLYKKMKVGEHLLYLARLRGLSLADARSKVGFWLKRLNAHDWENKTIEELSKGMQQKVQFIGTVVHDPAFLILDEPFSGLDPVNADIIKNEIYELNKKGTTIVFSTHRMEQVEEICREIVLINKGKNILQGRVDAIKLEYRQHLFNVKTRQLLEAVSPEWNIQRQEGLETVFQLTEDQNPSALLRELLRVNAEIEVFREILPTLHEIFIRKVTDHNS